MDARPPVKAIAIELDALGDTRRLWNDWRADAARRLRVEAGAIENEIPNWPVLLERFAEERAPVYLRPDAEVSATLRALHAANVRLAVFTEAPEPLARIALAQLGAARRVELVETGDGAEQRVLQHLGSGVTVVRTREQLLNLK